MKCYICGLDDADNNGICGPCRSGFTSDIDPERAKEILAAFPKRGDIRETDEVKELERILKAMPEFLPLTPRAGLKPMPVFSQWTQRKVLEAIAEGRFREDRHRCDWCANAMEEKDPDVGIDGMICTVEDQTDQWAEDWGISCRCPFFRPQKTLQCKDHGTFVETCWECVAIDEAKEREET